MPGHVVVQSDTQMNYIVDMVGDGYFRPSVDNAYYSLLRGFVHKSSPDARFQHCFTACRLDRLIRPFTGDRSLHDLQNSRR